MASAPRSMTGYGAGQAAGSRLAVEIEIRAVNARSLKTSLRLPSFLAPREPDLESIIRKRVRRGSITCYVRVSFLKADDLLRIRPEVVAGFKKAIDALRKQGLVEGPLTVEALVTGAAGDLDPSNDGATASLSVSALPDLQVSASAPAGPFAPGETVEVLVEWTNVGTTAATDVLLTFESADPALSAPPQPGSLALPSLAVGESGSASR